MSVMNASVMRFVIMMTTSPAKHVGARPGALGSVNAALHFGKVRGLDRLVHGELADLAVVVRD